MAVNEEREVMGYRYVHVGKMLDAIRGGMDANEAFSKYVSTYGHRRLVEIARALMTRPRLLMLDEASAGMNPAEAATLMEIVGKIRDTGISVFAIEHNMRVVMGIADRITVINFGEKIAEGTPKEIISNEEVIDVYLGRKSHVKN
ncbi:MAG: hypothetical protein ABFC62_08840, partial [Clostridiaceae bacterium]